MIVRHFPGLEVGRSNLVTPQPFHSKLLKSVLTFGFTYSCLIIERTYLCPSPGLVGHVCVWPALGANFVKINEDTSSCVTRITAAAKTRLQ